MAATHMVEGDEESNNHNAWEELLRKMLPPGAPLPDEDHLDYSIAVEYHGPLPSHPLPKVNPVNFDDSFSIASSSMTSKFFRYENAAKTFHLKNLVNFNRVDYGHCSINDSVSNLNSDSLFSRQIRSKRENLEFKREEMSESRLKVNETDDGEVKKVKFDSETESKRYDDGGGGGGGDGDGDDDDAGVSQCSSAVNVVQRERKGSKKRGVCSRCGKGNRLSEREICIVCDAKYCSFCLIKAMGSMQEGRKCVGCIGQPIEESKRECLGKVSKIMRRVCSSLEVKQIVKAEKECFANQLRPEQLVVNGRHLVAEEMVELLGCWLPPQNVKPGNYWYDKDSGLWGKEGEKPDRIISSKINVGGKLQANASNGSTQVFFNGREITKAELRVLKVHSTG
ncbi:Extra-large guanine nucleotide-binding protein 3 [Bienertia sinuspersici]